MKCGACSKNHKKSYSKLICKAFVQINRNQETKLYTK